MSESIKIVSLTTSNASKTVRKTDSQPSPVTEESETERREKKQEVGTLKFDRNEDLFGQSVEIAAVSIQAQKQLDESHKKVKFINDLARQAKEECLILQDVVAGLAATATAMASMALKICSYSSVKEAYESNSIYSEKLDIDSFTDVLEGKQIQESDLRSDHSSRCLCCEHHQTCGKHGCHDFLYEDGALHRGSDRTGGHRRHSEDVHAYPENQFYCPRGHFYNYNQLFYRDKMVSGRLNHAVNAMLGTAPTSKAGPQTGRSSTGSAQSKSYGSTTMPSQPPPPPSSRPGSGREQPLPVNRSSSTEKFVEKFPRQIPPDEYKESLIQPFNNSDASMVPLWEDRYCHLAADIRKAGSGMGPSTTGGSGLPALAGTVEPPSWSERKLMKQFQMKFHQNCPDPHAQSDTNVSSTSNSGIAKPTDATQDDQADKDRPTTPTPPRDINGREIESESLSARSDNWMGYARPDIASDISLYDTEFDAEVASLLGPKQLHRLKDTEHRNTGSQRVTGGATWREVQHRPLSPLLNNEEKVNYGLVKEEKRLSPKPIEKHVFQPKTVRRENSD